MIISKTVSAMKQIIVKYPLNMISLNPIDKKAKKNKYIGNQVCETDLSTVLI